MAFLCDGCHVLDYGSKGSDWHYTKSYGTCEVCKKTNACTDCTCYANSIVPRRN